MAELELKSTHLEIVSNWGLAAHSPAYVYRPSTLDQLRDLVSFARQNGKSIAFRGGGNSYGDAFSNREEIVIDISRFSRVLAWDPEKGEIHCEAGVTIRDLWEYVLPDGWWPPIVTGTARPTLGGCLSMNTHGKNAWKMGTIGEHVLAFEILLADGRLLRCTPNRHKDLFYAAIGGMGMLGCIVSVKLKLKRVYSGHLKVHGATTKNLGQSIDYIENHKDQSDYIVGWIDAMVRGRALGRGVIHRARYLEPGEDRFSNTSLQVASQQVSDSIFGILPKSSMWFYMRPFVNNFGWRFVNIARYYSKLLENGAGAKPHLQVHSEFHFLLDFIPNWKWGYGPGGLIQYQCFLPAEHAEAAFLEIFKLCQRRGLPNYLSVLKRHRPDPFLISYGLDGYSMAMDFKITERNRSNMVQLSHAMDEIVLHHGGRFYLAKDSTLRPDVVCAYLGSDVIDQFRELKRGYDPENLFQSNMWRRLFL